MVRLALIHSPPHVLTSTQEIRINGGEYAVKLIGRWIGVARIIYSIATLEEPLGLLTIQGMLSSDGVNIVIRPRSTHETGSGVSIGGYTELGTTMEGRLGDLRSLIEYDYEKPASMIHWLTSARVNELMMISRGDYVHAPPYSS